MGKDGRLRRTFLGGHGSRPIIRYVMPLTLTSAFSIRSRRRAPRSCPQSATCTAEAVIEAWRREYNEERPKEGLGGLTPAVYARRLMKEAGTSDRRTLKGTATHIGGTSVVDGRVSASRPCPASQANETADRVSQALPDAASGPRGVGSLPNVGLVVSTAARDERVELQPNGRVRWAGVGP